MHSDDNAEACSLAIGVCVFVGKIFANIAEIFYYEMSTAFSLSKCAPAFYRTTFHFIYNIHVFINSFHAIDAFICLAMQKKRRMNHITENVLCLFSFLCLLAGARLAIKSKMT